MNTRCAALRSLCASTALLLAAAAMAQDVPKVAGTEVPPPKRTKFIAPEYPADAQAHGIRGIVILELLIDEQGKVASVEVIRSIAGLDEAAIAAVRKWEFEITKVDGKPVRVRHTVPITFALKLPEMTRQQGIPELRQGAVPPFPQGAPDSPATVTAEVTLDAQGNVIEAQVKSGESPFAEALIQALRTWRFQPPAEEVEIAFRVKAEFNPGSKGTPPRVALELSGLRRSETMARSEPAPAAATASSSPSPSPPSAAAPSSPPSPAPSPAPKAAPVPPSPAPSPATTAQPAPAPAAADAGPSPAASPSPGSGKAPAAPAVEVIRALAATPSPAPRPTEPGVSAIRDVTLGVGVPDLVKGRRPVVPPLVRMGGTGGHLEVRFAVDAAGNASVSKVEGSELLKDAAQQTVASWSFRRTSAERLRMVAELTYEGESATAAVRLEEQQP